MTKKIEYAAGDINSTAKGSGARANSGKISFAITPLPLLAGCARVWMSGLLKYAPWNWAKGMKWSIPFDCLCRHLFKWWYLGEDIDPESGEHHLDLVFCNLFMLKHYTKTFHEGDDRPPAYADFAPWLEDFNTPFDEAAFLERNPDIAAMIEERKAKEAGVLTQEAVDETCAAAVEDAKAETRRQLLIKQHYSQLEKGEYARRKRGGDNTHLSQEEIYKLHDEARRRADIEIGRGGF